MSLNFSKIDGTVMTIDGKRLSLKEVLIFFTAAEKEPPLGFPGQPTLTFLHGACDVLPTASTCSLTLRLPATRTLKSLKTS